MVYLVIVLGILAFWQLIKVYEYSAIISGSKEEKVTEKDTRMNARLMMIFCVVFFAFCIAEFFEYKDKLLPHAASQQGEDLDVLFNFNMVIIGIVFFVVNFMLFYFASKYYFKKDNKATFFTHSNKLEMIWTIVPAIVLSVIIIYGLKTWNNITAPIDSKEAIQIELYAKQFDWTARYGGKDNELGRTNYRLITDANPLALVADDPNASDDIIVKGEFHMPVGKMVQFKMRSRDVIHSAFLPHFRAQMNAVPGMQTEMHFVPKYTTAQMREMTGNPKFNYILLCNKICGAAHYNMQMDVIVESEEDYNKWLATKKTFTQTTAEAASAEMPKAMEAAPAMKTDTAVMENKAEKLSAPPAKENK
jgi:cytochrome c oxidase subunit 2